MKILTKKQFLENKEFYIKEIISGKVFIYPTDTIYGIGCNATLSSKINKIKEIKQRENKPFSIIAPNKIWIKENCEIQEKYLEKLPGPITLILKIKNKNCISKEVNNSSNTLGVRIPNNWFSKIIKKANIPFITTSVNISGQKHITNIDELKTSIKNKVDYIINSGTLSGNPSTIIDLTSNKVKIIKR
jgi:L-threonylcarbamoyladenylate synthase